MSARVSTSSPENSACSGAMYSGVPIIWRNSVNSVFSVSRWFVAFAMPKSITFGTGLPSCRVTRMFDGLMSRWMIPFWWACCTARHTCWKSSSRSPVLSDAWSQYSVMGMPLTSSITKKGRPAFVAPAGPMTSPGASPRGAAAARKPPASSCAASSASTSSRAGSSSASRKRFRSAASSSSASWNRALIFLRSVMAPLQATDRGDECQDLSAR